MNKIDDYTKVVFYFGFQLNNEWYGWKAKKLYNLKTLQRITKLLGKYEINKKTYTEDTLKDMTVKINITKDISYLNWHQQCDIHKGI